VRPTFWANGLIVWPKPMRPLTPSDSKWQDNNADRFGFRLSLKECASLALRNQRLRLRVEYGWLVEIHMEPETEIRKIATEPRSSMSGIVATTIAVTILVTFIVLIAKYANPPTVPAPLEATHPSQP
jgi:hypothetical protein